MKSDLSKPLAERVRPRVLSEVLGQEHLLGEGGPLRLMLEGGRVPSIVFWGPPGVGKTTLARLIAQHVEAEFITLSAVLAGVKEIREAVATAQANRSGLLARATILFIDEIHRFNKSQQDALLPFVEDGTLTLIGATTENPSFELNGALLSRVRVLVLRALDETVILSLLQRTLSDAERGLAAAPDALPARWLARIAEAADGDARKALVLLETAYELGRADADTAWVGGAQPRPDRANRGKAPPTPVTPSSTVSHEIDDKLLERLIGQGFRRFDKMGENFYDQISALHKSVRGSDPDAALYWFCRMIDGGVDAGYVARRVTRMAYEDIGLADPRALQLALDAWQAYERIGSPEAELAIAEAIVYLAVAPKSNAIYSAYKAASAAVREHGSLPVPMHLRNAPTKLMKDLDYGKGYRYDHDEAGGHAEGQQFLPDKLAGKEFYQPGTRGLEGQIAEKLKALRASSKERK